VIKYTLLLFQSIYDTLFLTFYNVTFTSLPIFLNGLFEKHVPEDVLLENPKLYRCVSCVHFLACCHTILLSACNTITIVKIPSVLTICVF